MEWTNVCPKVETKPDEFYLLDDGEKIHAVRFYIKLVNEDTTSESLDVIVKSLGHPDYEYWVYSLTEKKVSRHYEKVVFAGPFKKYRS